MRARTLGGGALLDLGVYPVSLAHLLLGVPQQVRAWAKLSPEGVDENTGIVLGYDRRRGRHAELRHGRGDTAGRRDHRHHRPDRPARAVLPAAGTRPCTATGAEPEMLPADLSGGGYQHEAAEVQRCLAAGLRESPLVPQRATLEVMALLDDIRAQIGVDYA